MRLVYQSFAGRFSDSPRVIYEALARRGDGHEHLWLTDPARLGAFPPGVATVELASEAGIAALEAADVVVANTHTEVEWVKPPGAIYVQTWHGTPLKRIHRDVLWAPEGRHDELQRDVDRWDLLVSPNAVSTPRLRQAFRFEGEVLEAGYPRNDILTAPERDAVRERVRASLGIADGVRAVLYAPTWRDDFVLAGGTEPLALALDVERTMTELGPDHCLLLRMHYLLTDRLQPIDHPAVRDVSAHPDISELYLAADVLVTDYSSAMFDFAVTGKPQLFFTYDLASYRDRLRGFYFDFASLAPGPLLESTDEVIGALRGLEDLRVRYAGRYAAFRERFCRLGDGRATDRVIERLLTLAAGR